jgi:hypothetical protein
MTRDVVFSETANHRHIGFRFAVCRGDGLLGVHGPAVGNETAQATTRLGRGNGVGWIFGLFRHQPAFEQFDRRAAFQFPGANHGVILPDRERQDGLGRHDRAAYGGWLKRGNTHGNDSRGTTYTDVGHSVRGPVRCGTSVAVSISAEVNAWNRRTARKWRAAGCGISRATTG